MTGKVAVITGGSGSIGAGLVAGYRRRGRAVVASARVIEPSGDASLLTVAADITERAAADRVIDAALGRFGRIDTLVNAVSLGITQTTADPPAEKTSENPEQGPQMLKG
jgi:NAD(P)-dependent dehydrogenase (short-subunit alcohol dehydrogenase family)